MLLQQGSCSLLPKGVTGVFLAFTNCPIMISAIQWCVTSIIYNHFTKKGFFSVASHSQSQKPWGLTLPMEGRRATTYLFPWIRISDCQRGQDYAIGDVGNSYRKHWRDTFITLLFFIQPLSSLYRSSIIVGCKRFADSFLGSPTMIGVFRFAGIPLFAGIMKTPNSCFWFSKVKWNM